MGGRADRGTKKQCKHSPLPYCKDLATLEEVIMNVTTEWPPLIDPYRFVVCTIEWNNQTKYSFLSSGRLV